MRNILSFLVFLGLSGCGGVSTLKVAFDASNAGRTPDLVIIVSSSAVPDEFAQNADKDFFGTNGISFHNDGNLLPQCSVALNGSGGLASVGSVTSGQRSDCEQYAARFTGKFTTDPSSIPDALSAKGYSVSNTANGYLYVLFFFTNQTNKCVQVFTTKIQSGKIISATGEKYDRVEFNLASADPTPPTSTCFGF